MQEEEEEQERRHRTTRILCSTTHSIKYAFFVCEFLVTDEAFSFQQVTLFRRPTANGAQSDVPTPTGATAATYRDAAGNIAHTESITYQYSQSANLLQPLYEVRKAVKNIFIFCFIYPSFFSRARTQLQLLQTFLHPSTFSGGL